MAYTKKGRKVALVAGLALVVLSVAVVSTYWGEIRSWHALWQDFERLGTNEQGYPEYRHRETGIVMVRVPGGTFQMGSPETEIDHEENEGPVHDVRLSPFLVAKYEVTQKQWEKVMGSRPSGLTGDDLPIDNVLWEECKEFCERTGLALPTEAQWEYACRAETTTPFFFGENITPDQINHGRKATVPVDSFRPNAFGLHQMHGNVWELCRDIFDHEYYAKPDATEKDPLCASGSNLRVVRGGSWYDSAGLCRSAYRGRWNPSNRSNLGFRPARSTP